jgi:hypothetical protein
LLSGAIRRYGLSTLSFAVSNPAALGECDCLASHSSYRSAINGKVCNPQRYAVHCRLRTSSKSCAHLYKVLIYCDFHRFAKRLLSAGVTPLASTSFVPCKSSALMHDDDSVFREWPMESCIRTGKCLARVRCFIYAEKRNAGPHAPFNTLCGIADTDAMHLEQGAALQSWLCMATPGCRPVI